MNNGHIFLTEDIYEMGINKELISSFKELKKALNTPKKNRYGYDAKNVEVASIKIENILQKKFNFESLVFQVEPADVVNAYTFPISIYGDTEIEINADGYKFKNSKGKSTAIFIYKKLVNMLSAEEVIAIILHEIGHSFYIGGFLKKMHLLTYEYVLFMGDYKENKVIEVNEKRRKMRLARKEELNDHPFFNFIGKFFEVLIKNVLRIFFMTGFVSASILRIFLPFFGNAYKLITSENYNGEKFADAFVDKHGFGVHLVSAFTKMSRAGIKKDKEMPPSVFTRLAVDLSILIEFMYMDEHPNAISRMENTLKFLKKEYKSTKNKKLKKQLKNEIKYVDSIIKIFADNTYSDGLTGDRKKTMERFKKIDRVKEVISFSGSDIFKDD